MSMLAIRKAESTDVEALAPLFDAYRQFYEQPADLAGAWRFLSERMSRGESTIFLAELGGQAAGFAQLYPCFTSAGMARIFILNDLFVTPEMRGQGVATALLRRSAEFGRAEGAVRLSLSTATDNLAAQTVYEREGWKRDDVFLNYRLGLE